MVKGAPEESAQILYGIPQQKIRNRPSSNEISRHGSAVMIHRARVFKGAKQGGRLSCHPTLANDCGERPFLPEVSIEVIVGSS